MITSRKSTDRGSYDHGWLDTRHTFSFGEYHHPGHMAFRSLRVLNEDRVQPGRGFGAHGHRDMDILSYVLSGAIKHEDSEGNSGIIRPGDLQRMSAGTGIRHSEANASATESVHFLQIWIIPAKQGLKPGYEQKHFPEAERRNVLKLVASPDGSNGSVTLAQDAKVYAGMLDAGTEVSLDIAPGRGAWVQVARGKVVVSPGLASGNLGVKSQAGLANQALEAGDGAAIENEREIVIRAEAGAELLVFDLA